MRQSWGMGLGPVPIDKLHWYADWIGLSGSEQEVFITIMRALDNRQLDLIADKRAK